ncbi:MAG: ROK family protein [Verrucomicrobia bacterium]|nr:ROK family protein [Verrucomicrobiota bacterium]
MTSASHKWGIDLGGTKIEGVIMDSSRPGESLFRLRRETGASHGYEHILSQIEGVISDLESSSGLTRPPKIGIGTPGAMEPSSGRLKNSNTTCLNDQPILQDLERLTGSQILMANDANCFALAEALIGAAAGASVVFGVILGTGVGGGVVVNGHILPGLHGIGGEWGHNPLRGESHPCYCGRSGCIEGVIAGPSLERFYREQGGDAVRLPEISLRAQAGEKLAIQTLERLREKFAESIAAVINILDPDAIILGGGVGNLPLLYEARTRESVLAHIFNKELRTRILPPTLGDSAGVFGAALLVD